MKVFNIVTNKVVRVLGSREPSERFLGIALYQGTPRVDTQYLLSKGGAEAAGAQTAEQLHATPLPDPTVYCTR